MIYKTDSEQATLSFGQVLAGQLPADSVVSLNGTLGAGKSVLVRGFAIALGIDPDTVTSPTFTLWQTYRGPVNSHHSGNSHHPATLHHLDAYRLDSLDDFYDLGGEELFEMPGLKLIEWGDRIAAALPEAHYRMELTVVDESQREVKIESFGGLAIPDMGPI